MNNVALIVMAVVIVILPPWIIYFYCKNFDKWRDEEFEEKYGATFEGLRKDRRSTLAYPVIFMLRRFALVIVVVIKNEENEGHLFLQLAVMILFSTMQVAYLSTFNPSEYLLGQKLDIFNEVTTVALVDLLTVFSAANLTKFDQEADLLFLIVLFGNVTVHLFFLIKTTVVETRENCRKRKMKGKNWCCRKKKSTSVGLKEHHHFDEIKFEDD